MRGLSIRGKCTPEYHEKLFTDGASEFLVLLHRQFNFRRLEILSARKAHHASLKAGKLLDYLPETRSVRLGNWQVAPTPSVLWDRRVEITGPADAKMMINALNCGAKTFMCDLEDSLSPTWSNSMDGQLNIQAAVRGTLQFKGEGGKEYKLSENLATLLIRPRGWHLPEKNIEIDGERASGSLIDFGLAFYHNAKEQLARGFGPFYYLPKLENHLEARLWNDVFKFAQSYLGLPLGTIKSTVLIETITAAFEMDEILYELRDHITGLNAGRWDYIFSIIKNFSFDRSRILPDRSQVTMAVPFMQAYCEKLVETCHRRGAHAMGGMAAFIPSRRDPEVNRIALAKVKEDKDREARLGFDGTWIAHPDLVAVAEKSFTEVLGSKPNQKDKALSCGEIPGARLIDLTVEGGKITTAGVQANINVAVQYIDQWLSGLGAVALHNLMEDAATAEIARAQLWQWVHHGATLEDGRKLTSELYQTLRDSELGRIGPSVGGQAVELLDALVLSKNFEEFLTLPAYEKLS